MTKYHQSAGLVPALSSHLLKCPELFDLHPKIRTELSMFQLFSKEVKLSLSLSKTFGDSR